MLLGYYNPSDEPWTDRPWSNNFVKEQRNHHILRFVSMFSADYFDSAFIANFLGRSHLFLENIQSRLFHNEEDDFGIGYINCNSRHHQYLGRFYIIFTMELASTGMNLKV